MKLILKVFFILSLGFGCFAKSRLVAYRFQHMNKSYFVTFHHYLKNDLFINESCMSNNKPSCQLSKLKVRLGSYKFSKDDLKGGKNPGSILCSKALAGNVHRAKKIDNGVIKTFCHLKSGAMISLDGLYFLYHYKGENPWK